MNDNHKTRDHGESRATTADSDDRQSHTNKDQMTAGKGEEKSTGQTGAMHKKLKRNSRPRPLL